MSEEPERGEDAQHEELLDALAEVELPASTDEVGWAELAQRFLPIYLQAARGDYEISPQQRQILDKIMDRGFGKAGKEPAPTAPAGVVVLPTLYSDEKPVEVCPVCKTKLEELEEEED